VQDTLDPAFLFRMWLFSKGWSTGTVTEQGGR